MPRGPDLAKRQAWRRRLLEFDRGSTTIVEFCRRERVPVWSFYHWRRKLKRGTAASGGQSNGRSSPAQDVRPAARFPRAGSKLRAKFFPIEITGRPSIEVYLPNGARVTVPGHDREAIRTVIAALVSSPQEDRPC
jgi:hypothetical protein